MKLNRRKKGIQVFDEAMGWVVVGITVWGIFLALGEIWQWIW